MSFDSMVLPVLLFTTQSQSLSIRAMSFDNNFLKDLAEEERLNPFRSGQCLSTLMVIVTGCKPPVSQSLSIRAMSFDVAKTSEERKPSVSIPFDQGNVFRLQRYAGGRNHAAFQTYFPIFLEG